MLVSIIVLLCLYYIFKVVRRKYPNFLVDLRILLVDKFEFLVLNILYFLYFKIPLVLGFPNNTIATQLNEKAEPTVEIKSNGKTKEKEQLKTAHLQKNCIRDLNMALVLDSNHLENILCSACGRYLSVLPIKAYPSGMVKCGRCCKENDGGTTSLYEYIAKNCLFKCINRYAQCTKLLTVYEVLQHEKDCFADNYDCPKCQEKKFSGSAYDFQRHYKVKHPMSVIKENKFYIDVKGLPIYKERYLYLKHDIIFIILIENLYGESLYLSVVSLTPHKYIKQQFDLKYFGESITYYQTELKSCSSLKTFKCDYFKIDIPDNVEKIKCKVNIHLSNDLRAADEIPMLFKEPEKIPVASEIIQTVPLEKITGVELTDQFKQEYPDYKLTPCGTALFGPHGKRIDLTCSRCRNFTGTNVFNCSQGKHVMCWDCRKTECQCMTLTDRWDVAVSSVNELLLLPCRFKCGNKFPGDSLRDHEGQCSRGTLIRR